MGKPENKLGLLWRMGMPVVTSATPAYTRAMNEAGQSLTCKDDAEWMSKLENLILDEQAAMQVRAEGNTRFAVLTKLGFTISGMPFSAPSVLSFLAQAEAHSMCGLAGFPSSDG